MNNWNPEVHGKNVVRLSFRNGTLTVDSYPVRAWFNTTKRLVFRPQECPPDHPVVSQGLKFDRLFQFHFYPPGEAVMLVPESEANQKTLEWFISRVNRLRRKGIMKEIVAQEQKKVELHVVHTSCKDCIFAGYEDKTQKDCVFGDRLRRYANEGVVVEAYDNEAEFYIINGRRCLAYRNHGWGTHYKRSEWAGKVREELTQKVDIVIPLMGEVHTCALQATLESLKGQRLKPNALHVISNQDAIPVPKLHAMLTVATRDLPFPYYLTNIIERQANGERVPQERAIDLTVSKMKGHFYGIFRPGAVVPPGYVQAIDREVVDRLARFMVLLPNSNGDGLTVAVGFHKSPFVQGNRAMTAAVFLDEDAEPSPAPAPNALLTSVAEKASFIAQFRDMPFLVARLEDVCGGF